MLDSNDGNRVIADAQKDGAASREVCEGRQRGTEGEYSENVFASISRQSPPSSAKRARASVRSFRSTIT